jgi:hypothetical protein
MRIAVEVIDAARVEGRSAADHAVDFVAFGEQELGEIRSVLTRDTGDEGFFHEMERGR